MFFASNIIILCYFIFFLSLPRIERNGNAIGNNDLYRTFVKFHLSRTCMNSIMQVLRNHSDPPAIRQLPADFRTAVGEYPKFKIVKSFDSVDSEKKVVRREELDKSDLDDDDPDYSGCHDKLSIAADAVPTESRSADPRFDRMIVNMFILELEIM